MSLQSLSSKGRQKTNSLTQWKALPSPSPFADNYANVNSFIGAGAKSNRLPSSMLGHNHKSQHGSNSARSGLGMRLNDYLSSRGEMGSNGKSINGPSTFVSRWGGSFTRALPGLKGGGNVNNFVEGRHLMAKSLIKEQTQQRRRHLPSNLSTLTISNNHSSNNFENIQKEVEKELKGLGRFTYEGKDYLGCSKTQTFAIKVDVKASLYQAKKRMLPKCASSAASRLPNKNGNVEIFLNKRGDGELVSSMLLSMATTCPSVDSSISNRRPFSAPTDAYTSTNVKKSKDLWLSADWSEGNEKTKFLDNLSPLRQRRKIIQANSGELIKAIGYFICQHCCWYGLHEQFEPAHLGTW
uniref:Uncharacterized protein n=1 Tax=Meloidogyne javanica TaxID=6303 RepID=A0A915MJ80_MELJA